MMDAEQEQLSRQIEAAKADEDRAWATAAEMRRQGASGSEMFRAIQLVEAATFRRMNLEEEARRAGRS